MPLTPVSLTDTFDVWRVRTNQVITLVEDANAGVVFANTVAKTAYDKANTANYLAFLVNANTVAAFDKANGVGTGANSYLLSVIAGANTAVGAGANAFASATISGANTAVGAGANAYALSTVSGVGAGANAYATSAAAGANAYMIAVQNGSNTYLLATLAGANTAVGAGANSVGIAAFAKANTAGGGFYRGNNGDIGSVSGKNDIFRVNNNYINQNTYFSAGENASATGPLSVNVGFVLQINTDARVVII